MLRGYHEHCQLRWFLFHDNDVWHHWFHPIVILSRSSAKRQTIIIIIIFIIILFQKMDTELLETDNFLNLVSLPCDQDEPVEAATTTVAATTTTTGEETPPTAAAPHPQLAYSAVPRKTKEMIQEWRKITENFAKQVLDPCYLNLPIRSTTIKGAALLPGIFSLLDSLSIHEMKQLNVSMDTSSKATFQSIYQTYQKLHAYKGQ